MRGLTFWGKRRLPPGLGIVPLRTYSRETRDEAMAAARASCHVVPLPGDRALCRVLGRYLMLVDRNDIGLAPHLMLNGFWEISVTETLRARVQRGMTVADLGANVGYFTLLMADLVGPQGHVHAFEPNPAVAGMLQDSLGLNGFGSRVTVCRSPRPTRRTRSSSSRSRTASPRTPASCIRAAAA